MTNTLPSQCHDKRLDRFASERTSEVARIATDLCRRYPGMTRTEALKMAKSMHYLANYVGE